MTGTNEVIASSLRAAIEKLEVALKSGAKFGNEFLLKGELFNKQAQLAEVRQDEAIYRDKKDEKSREAAATISYLVDKETKLSAHEKEQYSQFLSKDYFTKSDFSNLESFYENSWSKLSDSGKSQMSHRVWEGVRRGEYSFDELPDTVKKKEADWLHLQITGQKEAAPWVQNLPEQDREDFKKAYEAKDQKAVEEVLNRESFSQGSPGKSASVEADSSRSIDKTKEEKVESKTVTTDELAFGAEKSPINPTDIRNLGGSSRSPS